MSKKWTKKPRGWSMEDIREHVRKKIRKQKFVRRLKYGNSGTDDPGPR